MARVLIVDDDDAIRRSLARALGLEGFDVDAVGTGAEALGAVSDARPDVVVLDLGLPDIDGVEVCRRLDENDPLLPVLILSARDGVADRVGGLEAGADDYLVKPFAMEELVARIRAVLRRGTPLAAGRVVAGPISIDMAARTAKIGDRQLDLTRREFDLLAELVRNQRVVLTRHQLLEGVWGYDFEVDTNVVDVFIGYLRRKLEADDEPRLIHTLRGVGFVLDPDVVR